MRSRMFLLSTALVVFVVTGCSESQVVSPSSTPPEEGSRPAIEVVATADVPWTPLNPARGDQSPKAGALWGDRTGPGPSGFLVRFADGFSSPPHMHNVSYRGLVIAGLVHNDDPGAANMWLPAGSFWTQPAGEVHVTAAGGIESLAYIEIEDGPYLVRPTEEAFDDGERPFNVHASNLVWVDSPAESDLVNGPKLAFLWGSPQTDRLSGTLVKLPAGFAGEIRGRSSTLRAVVVQGLVSYRLPAGSDVRALEPGSYFGAPGPSAHHVSCDAGTECILYVRLSGKLEVI